MTSISIVTCCYNAAATLPRTLKSLQAQTVPLEHILVDGASTDGSAGILEAYAKQAANIPSVRYHSEPDRGIYDAMNKGIAHARGDVVGLLNADDAYAAPDVLQGVLNLFDQETVDLVYGNLVYVKNDGEREIVTRYWNAGDYSPGNMYAGWMPPHPTCFVRRNVYERLGGFRLDLGSAADYELLLRFLLKYRLRVAYDDRVLIRMGVGGVSSSSIQNRLRAHAMDRKAWAVNDLKPRVWTLPLKPLRKVGQWWMRPPTEQAIEAL